VKENRTVAKWALIALKDPGKFPESYELARAPEEIREKVMRRWPEYFSKSSRHEK
jgi:hypothetical protein